MTVVGKGAHTDTHTKVKAAERYEIELVGPVSSALLKLSESGHRGHSLVLAGRIQTP